METLDVEQILEQDAYLGALTTARAHSLLHPQLERCLTGTGGIAPLVLQTSLLRTYNTLVKRKITVFFFSLKILRGSTKAEAIKC